ncbi:hypothetical protein [uncultured Legionella sp.]|uniref:hypothetical protein n=1 Tax=uncultured Legionella sp. TaxID=210934 RepID=UPI002625BC6D|nr:hypothetical protein [uncultured Legionella sp.]
MPEVLLIGDSFGVERIHSGVIDVPYDKTWPVLVNESFAKSRELKMESDFEAFRLLDELLDILDKKLEDSTYKLVIIQAGLVDCFPRPLPRTLFRSRNIICRILRKSISYIRSFWLKYIYCHPMVSTEALVNKFTKIINRFTKIKFIYITITPQLHDQAVHTPKQAAIIDFYNEEIKQIKSQCNNFDVFDFNAVCCQKYLHPVDSHLTLEGNRYLADVVIKIINGIYSA